MLCWTDKRVSGLLQLSTLILRCILACATLRNRDATSSQYQLRSDSQGTCASLFTQWRGCNLAKGKDEAQSSRGTRCFYTWHLETATCIHGCATQLNRSTQVERKFAVSREKEHFVSISIEIYKSSITKNLTRLHRATLYSCTDAPLRPQLRSVEPRQSARSLTVPARGRSASALSARYMLRAAAIVMNASSKSAATVF